MTTGTSCPPDTASGRHRSLAAYIMSIAWSKRLLNDVAALGRNFCGPQVLRYVGVTNEKVRNAKIDLSATYTNQFIEEENR